jgi:hypothetical protein
MTGLSPQPSLTPLAAWLDQWSRALLPYASLQTCGLLGLLMFFCFFTLKLRKTREIPEVDDCIRVALSTVTLLTAFVAILGLLLPTPPAPPELGEGVLRTVGLTAGIALISYALKTLRQLFRS